ncbi:MAG: pyrroline-5-carboxylate reductase [Deltaproteobacteria bacterium]|nr:pyrroline-5-carboxylate reductase [Deltaproteobacteria bacterium]
MGMNKGNVGFIGAGNMATALVKGLVKSGLYPPEHIRASDISREKLEQIREQFGLNIYTSNRALVDGCPVIVLSIKPQNMKDVLVEIGEEFRDHQLVISIAAGIPLQMIRDHIGRDIPMVRVMPNTPALIQKGVSALAAGKTATPAHMDIVKEIFEAVGETVVVSEDMMDAVTAVSGSGPGYVFRIMEGFVRAGEGLGFDRDISLRLVIQTFLGAAHLAVQSEKSLSELREMVTSPGGTTAAGLSAFEEKGLEETIKAGVEAACRRSVELGKGE